MNSDNDWTQVEITREEWEAYTPKQRKHFMGKLSESELWLAQFILECLTEYERQLAEENKISFEKTFAFYYGDTE